MKRLTEEHRRKISERQVGQHLSPATEFKKGHVPWNKGKTGIYSKELLNHMSESRKGKKLSEEHKRNISLGNKEQIPWIKGKHHTEETRRKIREISKGHPVTKETREKISKIHKGRIKSDIERQRISRGVKEKWKDPKFKRRISEERKGKRIGNKHPNWLGGISFEPYGIKFNKALKNTIKIRDDYQCQNPECLNISKKLIIHHINYDKTDNRQENLIILCDSCNAKANFKREIWQNIYEGVVSCQLQLLI